MENVVLNALVESAARSRCRTMVKYQKTRIKIDGITVPITKSTDGSMVKIGNTELSPTTLRAASDLIKALDIIQFSYCQDMRNLPRRADAALFEKILDHKRKAIAQLISMSSVLSVSDSEAEVEASITKAQKALAELTAGRG